MAVKKRMDVSHLRKCRGIETIAVAGTTGQTRVRSIKLQLLRAEKQGKQNQTIAVTSAKDRVRVQSIKHKLPRAEMRK